MLEEPRLLLPRALDPLNPLGSPSESVPVSATAAREVAASDAIGSATACPVTHAGSASVADTGSSASPIADAGSSTVAGQIAALPANLLPGARLAIGK